MQSTKINQSATRLTEALIEHLRARGCTVEETAAGIYAVGGAMLPVQIINSRVVSDEDNLWLASLDDRLEVERICRVDQAIEALPQGASYEVFWETIFHSNLEKMEDALDMNKARREIYQMLKRTGIIAECKAEGKAEGEKIGEQRGEKRGIAIGEQRGEQRGEKRGRTEIIDLLRQGVSPADIIARYGQ